MDPDYRHRYIALVTPDAVPDPPVRPASTVIVLRPGPVHFEVLTVRRGSRAAFMRNARVFPGGALEEIDRTPRAATVVAWSGDPEEVPWRAAALRELAEESGLLLAEPPARVRTDEDFFYADLAGAGSRLQADRLVYLSNWVTPRGPVRRYDTRFYVTVVDAGTEADADGVEVHDAAWVSPGEALRRAGEGIWEVEFPTRRHLELLDRFDDCRDVLDYAETQDQVARVEPRILFAEDGSWRVVLRGEPGYEEGLR
jgi:8-oxo-dGTP pyrophosphatase MutT (NUDIX family)